MNNKASELSDRYMEALRIRLERNPRRGTRPAHRLGRDATALGLETLDLARMHEQALSELIPENCSARALKKLRKQSSVFFLEALTPIEESNRHLKREILQRKAAEAALYKSEQHHVSLLKQSRHMEQRLRQLSHQVLSAQEEERKKISRELHDQIAQMLAGISVHLATFNGAAAINSVGMNRRIRDTQRMVEKSVETVHRFARELRPPVLDELGLIPACQSYMKNFTKRTGILVRFTVSAGIEELPSDQRLMLYRVTQAALTNVGQHAKATVVTMSLVQAGGAVRMSLHDDGRAFDVERVLFSRRNKRLGLIGMRERVEMVGGTFSIKSAPGEGTTIGVQLPCKPGQRPSSK